MSLCVHLTFVSFVLFSSVLHLEFNSVAPSPVHDENCHLKQVQYYCNGTFDKWNGVITTLPGLYLFSVGTLQPLRWLFGHADHCSMLLLRSLSLLKGFAIFILIHLILNQKYADVSPVRRALWSLSLSFFPMLYFYYFMYYTETLSMLLLLLMHYNAGEGRHSRAALYGALGVLTRQTNIVWVFWHAVSHVWTLVGPHLLLLSSAIRLPDEKGLWPVGDRALQADLLSLTVLRRLVGDSWLYLATGLGFLLFVVLNDGIVVGDRTNHRACLNLPQFLYFGLYTALFLLPVIVRRLAPSLRLLGSMPGLTFGLSALLLLTVHFKTMMHFYLLTDNRHYIHYVGSALYSWYPVLKYALVPLYLVSWTWIWTNLRLSGVQKLLLLSAIALSVVPQLLMEFRYFVPGFIFIRLHIKAFEWSDLGGELALYALVNYLTFTKFLYGAWETEAGIQRIMW